MARRAKPAAADEGKIITSPVKETISTPAPQIVHPHSPVRTQVGYCEDCRATTAFQAFEIVDLSVAISIYVSFAAWNLVPAGKRAVVELVTAQFVVPAGAGVRLRLYTSLGTVPGNFDMAVTPQGNVSNHSVYVVTHALRAYTDRVIDFDVWRDPGVNAGSGLIAVSGYIAN